MREEAKHSILILGIGNTSRQDDGLGWCFLDHLAPDSDPGLVLKDLRPDLEYVQPDLEYRYQLQIEDADLIAEYDNVVFVDSTVEETEEGFSFERCPAIETHQLFTHSIRPEALVHLCKTLYQKTPRCYLLAIQGYHWKLGADMTAEAKQNLIRALNFWVERVYCLPLDREPSDI